ncbi:drug/metabolite transporter (DMT)-like permease [Salsuginibacillus halophilus]|uniref:Drug/metabolite transporter (DMT)-like permease n=1 Tax=Salsuginibacillus halophilus TaxID=517424 RepID=A0A2P8HWH5_9BACI|nr:DMT family transporter [Salsuginibacillus halophilus]PSL50581.1 drug/metabolite transporter (DMT)-like permease [Salsuginibacillus halophilus]
MKERSMLLFNVLLLFVMLLWGVNVVAIKVLVEYLPPATMQGLRVLAAGVVLIVIIFVFKEMKQMKIPKASVRPVIYATLLGVTGHHFFLALGLAGTSAGNAALILALLPLATSVSAMLLLNDTLTRVRLTGVILGLAGVAVILFTGDEEFGGATLGDFFVFVSMIVQALSFIFIKKATNYVQPRVMTGVMFVPGSLLLLLLGFGFERNEWSAFFEAPFAIWVVFFGSAVLATAIGHQLYNAAIQNIGAGQTAVYNNFVPFFGLVSSALFLGEPIYATQLLGFLLIVPGVLLGTGYVEQLLIKKRKKAY